MKKIFSLLAAVSVVLMVSAVELSDSSSVAIDTVLNPNYRYAEPTIVLVPDSVIAAQEAEQKENEGKEQEGQEQEGSEQEEQEEKKADGYTFVSNNIRVTATKGEIEGSSFSVKKGGSLRLTATQKIKGIAIGGVIKPIFTATADKGQLEALYPDIETEAYPVLVVKNVNDTTLTITCTKKLLCHMIKVYFYANPADKIDGRTAPGDTVLFFCKQMIAEYKPYAEYDLLNDTVVVRHNYQIHLSHNNGLDSIYTASINITTSEKGKLQGNYAPKNNNLNADASFCVNGGASAVLTKAIDGLASIYAYGGDKYFVSGYLIGRDNKFYYFEFIGDAIIIDNTQSISEIESGVAGKSYDILGRPVSDDYKGIVIRDGKKYMVR